MVVSPQPRRPTPSLNVELVPSIEVVTPWSLAEESRGSPWASQGLSPTSDNCDETPLLHVSTPTSDIGNDPTSTMIIQKGLDKRIVEFPPWKCSSITSACFSALLVHYF